MPTLSLQANGMPAEAGNSFQVDAIIVGAGFSGIAMLHRVRQLGLKAKVFEAGGDLGGTWYWNQYPGARVDSEWPMYQLSIPEVYNTFKFSQRLPDHHEIRRYFSHVDSVINVKRDTYFNARVVDCTWADDTARWTIKTKAGHVAVCKYLMLCSGVFAKGHRPDFAGLDGFSGEVYHTAQWPQDQKVDFSGKRVGLVGMGATGVQVAQEVAKEADQLTVFVRRPSYCLPANQLPVSEETHQHWAGSNMDKLFEESRYTYAGFPDCTPWGDNGPGRESRPSFHDHTPAQREQFWEALWAKGGFTFARNNYMDVLTDKEANLGAYEFWANKIRSRMGTADQRKNEILAPLPARRAPYFIFTKRVPLEVDFYDVMSQPNVELVDLNVDPLGPFNDTGVRLVGSDSRQVDLDVLILATGFDAFAGAVKSMGLKNKDGVDIMEHWREGFRTYLGSIIHGFPNLFMSFTPHAPTAFSNAPTIIEAQCDFACSIVKAIETSAVKGNKQIKYIDPTAAAEDEWAAHIDEMTRATLLPHTMSWWNRSGINGKFQSLNYIKGIVNYETECCSRLDGWKGFTVKYWDD